MRATNTVVGVTMLEFPSPYIAEAFFEEGQGEGVIESDGGVRQRDLQVRL